MNASSNPFHFLFVNIDKVTILYYNNVVSMIISLLFHPFHVAEIKKIKRDILTLLANIILTLSPSQLSCKGKAMSKRIAHGFTFVIIKTAFSDIFCKKIRYIH